MNELCTKCQKPIDADGAWPDGTKDGKICYTCWEALCGDEFWEVANAFAE